MFSRDKSNRDLIKNPHDQDNRTLFKLVTIKQWYNEEIFDSSSKGVMGISQREPHK